ncbi:MAG: CmcJ/NvfI family oxidoreductase [Caulobacteraceae bacterium]
MDDSRAREQTVADQVRQVPGLINYIADMTERPRYYANDHSRDRLTLDPRTVLITDARSLKTPPSLRLEGFELVHHRSAVSDFRDTEAVKAVHRPEIEALLQALTGADRVVVSSPGVLRFSERSPDMGRFNNSHPARFIHIDISDATARQFGERAKPADVDRPVRRCAHYNVWRALSPPPQDVPLAVCDPRTVARGDLVEADAIFDVAGAPEWSFESWLLRYNPAHRWTFWSNMTLTDALVFKTNDSDPSQPHFAPHSAFDDPSCPEGAAPRASIEMRGIAYWF